MTNSNVLPMRSPGATGAQQTAKLDELSTEKRERWIEQLFARLLAMYGADFSKLWASVDPESVKAAWAEDLGPFAGPQIAWALQQLKANPNGAFDRPPSLPKFRSLCQQAPRPEAKALPAPRVAPEVAKTRAAQLEAGVSKIVGMAGRDHKKWARDILADPKSFPAVSVRMAREALAVEAA